MCLTWDLNESKSKPGEDNLECDFKARATLGVLDKILLIKNAFQTGKKF